MNNTIYRVRILPGGTPLEYRMPGGGLFSKHVYAADRYEKLKDHGCNVVLEQAIPVWEEV